MNAHEISVDDLVRQWLAPAIATTRLEEPSLWRLLGGERSVVAHIYRRLRFNEFKDWDIDLEYLREGSNGERKTAPAPRKWGIPDLIVHHRGRQGFAHNLAVIEFKLHHGILNIGSYDRRKIKHWQDRFDYQFGAVVDLGSSETATTCWSWRTAAAGWSGISEL